MKSLRDEIPLRGDKGEGIGIGVLNKNSSRFCIGSTNGIAPH
jgi:hypothetical protein